ncbi:MAG: sigma-70 family RNA polymerase sigma factor [Rhizobiales bacterium]|nr:sigma-70 family RNA polymerase sigma factor [Hyphomicrobiales bacterium]
MNQEINNLAIKAKNGSKQALEKLVFLVQDRLYNLANRMLVNPEDAYDATQEILILIITKLSTFKGESQFNTWLYRVATNYLLNAKKVKARELGLSFDMFKAELENGLIDKSPAADDLVLLNELRISVSASPITRNLRLQYSSTAVIV